MNYMIQTKRPWFKPLSQADAELRVETFRVKNIGIERNWRKKPRLHLGHPKLCGGRSSCPLCSEYGRYCLQQYIEIEPKALIADIEQVLRSLDPEIPVAA
jgi:hypothetical protein